MRRRCDLTCGSRESYRRNIEVTTTTFTPHSSSSCSSSSSSSSSHHSHLVPSLKPLTHSFTPATALPFKPKILYANPRLQRRVALNTWSP
ncbi:hypothetical protein E2C01_087335 [Portunus trituberculatus]|uniref:Uncharacterized protein n=1 Tax=Portunus trituberculatus TaxID=210409 RepID=A0A5B7JDS4_PORTR|nr:hypothetical protein [Portunus trituberculatus]